MPPETAVAPNPSAPATETTPAAVTPAAPVVPAATPVVPQPTGEAKPEPVAPVPAEAKVEPAKPEVKVELISKADQLKIPEKLGEAEVEFLKGKLEATAKSSIEGKMPLAEAQKAFENHLQTFREVAAFGDARLKAQLTAWDNAVKLDPKLGGDNLNRTSQLAERALTTLFGKDFYEKELKGLYLFHNPKMVEGLVKFAEAAGDSTFAGFGDKPEKQEVALTPGEKVYGKNYDPMNPSIKPKLK